MNLEEEFKKINIDNTLCTKSELTSYLYSIIYDLEEEEISLKNALIYNRIYCIRDILLDFINFNFQIDTDFYKEDYRLLQEMILLCKEYNKYFKMILASESNNLEDLYKLSVITNNNFRNNINYFESLRTSLTAVYSSFYFKDTRYVDNREEFKEFFNSMEKVYGKKY